MVLFVAVIAMIFFMPFYRDTRTGEITFTIVNALILLISALTNGAWRALYWVAVAIAAVAVTASTFAVTARLDWLLIPVWVLAASVHMLTIVRLVDEIFRARRITRDHLFACANAYLLMGVAWCYIYALLEFLDPGALSGFSTHRALHPADAIYFSFNVITSVALTQVMPTNSWAKMVVLLQELSAVLYMAFVISRLVGQYAPPNPGQDSTAP